MNLEVGLTLNIDTLKVLARSTSLSSPEPIPFFSFPYVFIASSEDKNRILEY